MPDEVEQNRMSYYVQAAQMFKYLRNVKQIALQILLTESENSIIEWDILNWVFPHLLTAEMKFMNRWITMSVAQNAKPKQS